MTRSNATSAPAAPAPAAPAPAAPVPAAPVPAATRRMAELLRRQVRAESVSASPVPGVHYMHTDRYIPCTPLVYDSGICILAGGRKVVRLGDQSFTYDADNFLVLSVPLPLECEVFGSPEEPILGFRIDIDPVALAELILEMDGAHADAASAAPTPPKGIFASRFTDELRSACLRLVESLASPADARILGPGIVREITYRILGTEQAAALRAVAVRHARFTQISKALHRIHADFNAGLSVEDLAAEAAMSPSSFHENFRAVTGTSPLQYLKTIRLHKARLVMINEGLTAAQAAVRVGYESPSQFSREFKRLFGTTPAHDAAASRASLLSA